jgi:hypothetical protein
MKSTLELKYTETGPAIRYSARRNVHHVDFFCDAPGASRVCLNARSELFPRISLTIPRSFGACSLRAKAITTCSAGSRFPARGRLIS